MHQPRVAQFSTKIPSPSTLVSNTTPVKMSLAKKSQSKPDARQKKGNVRAAQAKRDDSIMGVSTPNIALTRRARTTRLNKNADE